MRKLVCIILIITLGSCGIFKKNKNTKDEWETSVELENVETKKISANTSTTVGIVENLAVKDRSTSSKSIRADRIRLLPDGTIEADGNALYDGFEQKDLDSLKRREAFEESNKAYYEELRSDVEYEARVKEVAKTSESKTDGVGVVFGAVAVFIVAFGIMWLLRCVVWRRL